MKQVYFQGGQCPERFWFYVVVDSNDDEIIKKLISLGFGKSNKKPEDIVDQYPDLVAKGYLKK